MVGVGSGDTGGDGGGSKRESVSSTSGSPQKRPDLRAGLFGSGSGDGGGGDDDDDDDGGRVLSLRKGRTDVFPGPGQHQASDLVSGKDPMARGGERNVTMQIEQDEDDESRRGVAGTVADRLRLQRGGRGRGRGRESEVHLRSRAQAHHWDRDRDRDMHRNERDSVGVTSRDEHDPLYGGGLQSVKKLEGGNRYRG